MISYFGSQHIRFIHKEEKVSCDQCEMIFSRSSSLYLHKHEMHKGRTFPCQMCTYKSSRKTSLDQHMKKEHFNESDIQIEQILSCDICPWKSSDQQKLVRHKKSHFPKGRHICTLCDKSLSCARNLKQHIKYHSRNESTNHECSSCFFTSSSKERLQKQIKDIHTKNSCFLVQNVTHNVTQREKWWNIRKQCIQSKGWSPAPLVNLHAVQKKS